MTQPPPRDVGSDEVPSDPDLDDRKLERLLSGRDAPSATEREELFERIYARTEAGRRRWLAPAFAAALASAAAAVLMFMQLRAPADAEFRARVLACPWPGQSFR